MKQNNLRRMPTGDGIMEDKKFYDRLYAQLQIISFRNPEEQHRYVYKNFNKTQMAKDLKMSKSTFDRKFKYLLEKKIIIECEEYYKLPLFGEWYELISLQTLEILVNGISENGVIVYAYLALLYDNMKKENKKPYFTKSSLLMKLGYKIRCKNFEGKVFYRPSTNQRDWNKINDILFVLSKIGALEFWIETERFQGQTIEKCYYNINKNIINNERDKKIS